MREVLKPIVRYARTDNLEDLSSYDARPEDVLTGFGQTTEILPAEEVLDRLDEWCDIMQELEEGRASVAETEERLRAAMEADDRFDMHVDAITSGLGEHPWMFEPLRRHGVKAYSSAFLTPDEVLTLGLAERESPTERATESPWQQERKAFEEEREVLRRELDDCRDHAQTLERELSDHRDQAATMHADLDAHRAQASDLHTELADHRAQASALQDELAAHREQAEALLEERDASSAHAAAVSAELAAYLEHRDALSGERDADRDRADELVRDRDAWRERASEAEARLARSLSGRVKRTLRNLVGRDRSESESS